MTPEQEEQEKKLAKTREIVLVRGIAATLQTMSSPTFLSLDMLLKPYGFQIVKLTKSNQQVNNGNTNDENVG